MTWDGYGDGLEHSLADLHERIHRGAYRAQPLRRVFIPKPDGRERPSGIAALEDKIVPRALVEVLNAIWEQDFLGFSYGFRPGRGQHDALDALAAGISRCKVNWVMDADIAGFFDAVSHEWLLRFVQHRVGDRRVLRLIRFVRFAALNRAERGEGKPETFNFLGFTHIRGRSPRGGFPLRRTSWRDRVQARLGAIQDGLRRRLHTTIDEQGAWLRQVVGGFFAYHAVPTNSAALAAFRHHMRRLWQRALRRRSQKDRTSWERVTVLADRWLLKPRITHPWPSARFAVKYPGWSRMREFRPYGSVRGARSNARPYRDRIPVCIGAPSIRVGNL